ncbi:ATP-dependent Clp protease protease subunit [Bradyrhizobium sp. USDA 4524]|uniref:ATP-dependent Clp protease proteolytic subunit n=1 Tax=unclassified Bradyrhizobium TaxID=2631580 RepID=UPI00209FEB4B|nr:MULTISPECIES: ATP-dependent Clp protease proteolytic subunit [unclassified Bradyrhizobium]MCP1844038.1 ATP-dependent protease ClpP protease subunit [Bradyrhizobium sp. USDA 4538]MCP1904604.1 ATP-dependent protease ClpP protease subunit [Bradyrhizobium sp. USDA 4537]MCP1989740.1 ATP-dependent protease ClpP protease subunit [Bradyrhizobium sp. USDA 4539]
MADQYLFLLAEINQTSANAVMGHLIGLVPQPPDRLIVAINSPGGSVVSGIALYNSMRSMPYPIITHNIGNVDSIANVIYLAGSERYSCPASTFMFHGVGFNGNANERLEENNLKAKLDTILADHKRISAIISDRTGGSLNVRQGMSLFKEQRTRDAQWALSKNIATGVREFVLPANANVQFLA